jgi:hypothetical protein
MADSGETRPVARATKPVSEALLNEKVRTYHHIPQLIPALPALPVCQIGAGEFGKMRWLAFGELDKKQWANPSTGCIVGPRHLLDDHQVLPRSVLRCRLLRSSVQAESLACLGRPRLRCRSCLGGG